jgi:hypothetical protein
MKPDPIGTDKVLDDVKKKRQRQVVVHGRGRRADDAYVDGELARAAIPFIQSAYQEECGHLTAEELLVFWPMQQPPKLAQPRRELLINAAALLVAEVERLDRIDSDKLAAAGSNN